jgi:hypothetical protein
MMGRFGFLGAKTKPQVSAASPTMLAPRIELAHVTPAGGPPALAWSPEVVSRLSHLRTRLHQHLTASSRDYTILTSIKTSKIEYCETVSKELMKRLSSNPYFEVLQHLDAAQAQMGKTSLGGGR